MVIHDRDIPIARIERLESAGSGTDRPALRCARGSPVLRARRSIENASALVRMEQEKSLTADEMSSTLSRSRQLAERWHEIVPSDALRRG